MWWPSYFGTRPDVRCAFAAMRRCDAVFGEGTQRADECRSGARDAHLLDYTAERRTETYLYGQSTTLTTCPPTYDVGLARPAAHYHHNSHHDSRLACVAYYGRSDAANCR